MQLSEVMNAIEKALDDEREEVSASVWTSIEKRVQEALRAQADARPIGKVLSEEEMGIGYDRRTGPVLWFGTPKPGLIYTNPEASAPGLSDDERAAVKGAIESITASGTHIDLNVVNVLQGLLTRASAATVAEPRKYPLAQGYQSYGDGGDYEQAEPSPFEQYDAIKHAGEEAAQRTVELEAYLAESKEAVPFDPEKAAQVDKLLATNSYYEPREAKTPVLKAAQQQAEPVVTGHSADPIKIVALLREARASLEMWKDVAPAVSLCADIDKALATQQQAEPGADEPPLGGRWHHGNGVVVCGTLRIFGEDFDTDPAQDFKESILTWVCDTLNAAQDAYRAAQSGQQADVADGWQPIETAPKTGRTLLLGYPNSLGNWRTTRGQWMSDEYIAEYWEEPDNGEAGWFETSVEADDVPNCWRIAPTHWMPLPAAPTQQQEGEK